MLPRRRGEKTTPVQADTLLLAGGGGPHSGVPNCVVRAPYARSDTCSCFPIPFAPHLYVMHQFPLHGVQPWPEPLCVQPQDSTCRLLASLVLFHCYITGSFQFFTGSVYFTSPLCRRSYRNGHAFTLRFCCCGCVQGFYELKMNPVQNTVMFNQTGVYSTDQELVMSMSLAPVSACRWCVHFPPSPILLRVSTSLGLSVGHIYQRQLRVVRDRREEVRALQLVCLSP